MKDKFITITCPHCGCEYLPEEIYYSILGTPKNIIRDDSGKIISFNNTSVNLKEEYCCDKCGNSFFVSGKLKFKTYANESDLDEDFIIELDDEEDKKKEYIKTKELW